VKLQLEALWDVCSTDADIKEALANLPKDLNETYERCLARIAGQYKDIASKVLGWVCVAAKPFKINQLREALAINTENGCLIRENLLPEQLVLKCCSNLLIQNSDNQVLLAHYSVRQFLVNRQIDVQVFSSRFELSSAELELGQLCVRHLTSSDYTLALQPSNIRKNMQIPLSPTAIEKLTEIIPSWSRSILPKPRTTWISLPQKASKTSSAIERPSFFEFAKEQWAPLMRGIVRDSNCYTKFQTLALEPNLSWRLHPWVPIGESLDSHYAGMLGWAIANHHIPLLDLLLGLRPKPKTDIFDLPLHHYSNLPPLHLASRKGNIKISQLILQECNPRN